jgi:hypothetical protein
MFGGFTRRLCDPKVGKECSMMVINEDIRWLDIPMNNPMQMGIFEGFCDLDAPSDRLRVCGAILNELVC